jgi:hypothetical protein
MIANYLEHRWFRWLISIMAFIPLLAFELYGMPWGGAAWLAVIGIAAVGFTKD